MLVFMVCVLFPLSLSPDLSHLPCVLIPLVIFSLFRRFSVLTVFTANSSELFGSMSAFPALSSPWSHVTLCLVNAPLLVRMWIQALLKGQFLV